MKKIISVFMAVLITAVAMLPICAADTAVPTREIIYLEDGSYVEISEVYEVTPLVLRATNTRSGNVDVVHYSSDGELEWKYTLSATFTYEPGISSVCTNASYSNNIYDNKWSFSNGAATKSGNTAYGAGLYIKKVLLIKIDEYDVDASITCDTYGNLS